MNTEITIPIEVIAIITLPIVMILVFAVAGALTGLVMGIFFKIID